MAPDTQNLNFELLLEYISHGHAYDKHVLGKNQQGEPYDGQNAFRLTQPGAGPDLGIKTPDDLTAYIKTMVHHPETVGFSTPGKGDIVLYNPSLNTRAFFNTNNNTNRDIELGGDFGTIFRGEKVGSKYERDLIRSGATEFQNTRNPNAAREAIEDYISHLNETKPEGYLASLAEAPGVRAQRLMKGEALLAAPGLSPTYQTVNALRDSYGIITDIDAKGRPSHLFLLDQSNARVLEVQGRNLRIHNFDNLPEPERVNSANMYFAQHLDDAKTPISQGGYDGLIKPYLKEHSTYPLIGSNSNRVMMGLERGLDGAKDGHFLHFSEGHKFADLDEAAKALTGLSETEARLFNAFGKADNLPILNDDALHDLTGEMATQKEMALSGNLDEVEYGLSEFQKTASQLEPGQVKTLEDTVATAKTRSGVFTSTVADGVTDASDLAKALSTMKFARHAANLTKAGVVGTVASTSLSVLLTATANAAVLENADQFHQQGLMTDEAYTAYQKMMSDVGPMLELQAADPFITAIPGAAVVETVAYNRFDDFWAEHMALAPNNIRDALSPSIISGDTVRGRVSEIVFDSLPKNPDDAPDILTDLIHAKQTLDEKETAHNLAKIQLNGYITVDHRIGLGTAIGEHFQETKEAKQAVDQAQQHFVSEFDKVMLTAEGIGAITPFLSNEQLLDIVEETRPYVRGEQAKPIEDYFEAQERDAAWYNIEGQIDNYRARERTEDNLLSNRPALEDYAIDLFSNTHNTTEASLTTEDFQNLNTELDQITQSLLERKEVNGPQEEPLIAPIEP